MRKLCLCLILLLFVECVIADVVINEIMYNPSGSDSYSEWVELYNPTDASVNLTGWALCGDYLSEGYISHEDGELYSNITMVLQPNQYAVVTDGKSGTYVYDNFSVNSFALALHIDDPTICGSHGLPQLEGLVILRDNTDNVVDAISYSDSWGGDGNNFSLCKVPDGEGLWQECEASPGAGNNLDSGKSCDWELSLIINSTVTEDPEWQIKAIKVNGETKANITIKHWVEDSYGLMVKEYSNIYFEDATKQRTSSSYSPSLENGEGYFIKANITNISCSDNEISNSYLSELIFIQSGEEGSSNDSSIIIDDISPDSAEFGEIIKVKLFIYRGDTSKYAVYVYVEGDDGRVSEKSTMHIKTKYVNYSLTVPVQLNPNCDEDYEDGNYEVIVEGLNLEESKELEIEGVDSSLCNSGSTSSSSLTSSSSSSSSSVKFEYDLISKTDEVEKGEEVEVEVKLVNNDNEDYDIDIWSYVYRGSKCYSGEREENKQSFVLEENSDKIVSLKNTVEAEPGEYNIKIKIIKNNQKTAKEITDTIRVKKEIAAEEAEKILIDEEIESGVKSWSEAVVYESTSFKANKSVYLIFIIALCFLVIAVFLTKTF